MITFWLSFARVPVNGRPSRWERAPAAAVSLMLGGARFLAALEGRNYLIPDDCEAGRRLPVLRHPA